MGTLSRLGPSPDVTQCRLVRIEECLKLGPDGGRRFRRAGCKSGEGRVVRDGLVFLAVQGPSIADP